MLTINIILIRLIIYNLCYKSSIGNEGLYKGASYGVRGTFPKKTFSLFLKMQIYIYDMYMQINNNNNNNNNSNSNNNNRGDKMSKITVTFRCDEDIWNLFGELYPQKRGRIIEEYVKAIVYGNSDDNKVETIKELRRNLDILVKEITEKQIKVNEINTKLKAVETNKQTDALKRRKEMEKEADAIINSGIIGDLSERWS